MVEELRTASSKVGLEINLIETMASRPRQNFHQESEACINKQINMELYASYVYMSMSYYFDRDDVALKGFAKYFKKASDEEREHAEKFMKYQNKRGGRIALQDVKKPAKDSWDSPIEATKAALALEKEVNQALLNMHKVSDSHGDAQHAKRVSWRAFCSQVSRTNPFSDAYKLCRSEFRRKHLDEPLLDSNGHRYADVAEECKALMNYHLGDEDGIQPETIVTPEGNNTLAVNNINYDLDLRVPVDKIVHPSLSPPTWVNSHLKPITTQLNVKNLPLKIPHPLSMENKFLIIHKLIYTDGSKVPEVGVGAAFTLTSENYFRDKKLRLANHCNIFQAEMVAILQSLKTLYLLETMNENILIVTDSLSSILAIQNFDNRHRLVNSVIKYVDKLDMNNCKIYLEWVKSHSGNALNDKVDLLAKQAVSINYSKTFSRVPIDFIKSQIGIEARKEYHQWYSSLDNNLRIKTLFPKLRDLTNFIGSYEIGFIESQVITGHGHLKEYLHRRHVTVDPYCECDSVSIQNADHLLMVDSIMVEIASLRSHLEDAKGQLVKLISKDRIHKPDTVKYLNKSMKVALAKLSNIEKSVSEGATVVKERPSQPTYANVVAKAVASHRSPPETIIVESQDADIKTAGQLQALVKDSVNLREAKIGVTNIRHAGTKLIIKTQNSVDKGTLVNLINNTLKAKVKVWAPQKWRPNILVKNVPEDVKDDDIVDSILDQNNLAEGGRLLHKEKVLLQIGKGLLGMLFWMSAQACCRYSKVHTGHGH
ncbi:Soma ferritin [Nymphon striatum]|nr:Soma ferritin [Nymphon striatum]